QAIEAPFLTKDQRVRYDTETRTLVHAESEDEGIHIWTPADQSGLRRACRGGGLDFRVDDLLSSTSYGRVQIFDPKGQAKNLATLTKQLDQERDRVVEEANSRLKAAKHYVRTGKLPSK
ncbi:MAG: hypothetical protein ABIB47_05400, partial [Candidatus Woesearchaeota archaeon]